MKLLRSCQYRKKNISSPPEEYNHAFASLIVAFSISAALVGFKRDLRKITRMLECPVTL